MRNQKRIGYRTEGYSGSGVRDAVSVVAFEIFELGNTDILRTLRFGVLKHNVLFKVELQAVEQEIRENGYVDDMGDGDKTAFAERIIREVNKAAGIEGKYALWLASKDVVTEYYASDDDEIEEYLKSNVVLSSLGRDGSLYLYSEMPQPISRPA